MIRFTIILPLAAFLLLIGPGCADEQEPLPDALPSAYADLLSWRDSALGLDSVSFTQGVDSILAVHGFDRTSFTESFQQIGTGTDRVNTFFDSTFRRLKPPASPGY